MTINADPMPERDEIKVIKDNDISLKVWVESLVKTKSLGRLFKNKIRLKPTIRRVEASKICLFLLLPDFPLNIKLSVFLFFPDFIRGILIASGIHIFNFDCLFNKVNIRDLMVNL